MPASIHIGISSEQFSFLALSPHALLPTTGLCQLSVLVPLPPHCSFSPSPAFSPHMSSGWTEILQLAQRATLGGENHLIILLLTQN